MRSAGPQDRTAELPTGAFVPAAIALWSAFELLVLLLMGATPRLCDLIEPSPVLLPQKLADVLVPGAVPPIPRAMIAAHDT